MTKKKWQQIVKKTSEPIRSSFFLKQPSVKILVQSQGKSKSLTVYGNLKSVFRFVKNAVKKGGR